MAWENFKLEEQRFKLVQSYIKKEYSMTQLCKLYGISRKTGYKWLKRFLEYEKEGLKDLSKAPHNPYVVYNKELIDIAIDYKLRYRKWGPKKILSILKDRYPNKKCPSQTRLYEIYKEHHLVTPRRIRKRVPATSPLGP